MSNPSKYRFVLKGVDVSRYVFSGSVVKGRQPVKNASIQLKRGVTSVLTIDNSLIGKTLTIQRGVATSNERYVFRGEVLSYNEKGSAYEVNCACNMNKANRLETDYIYDEDIDVEAGKGSEIAKSLFGNVGLNTTDESCPETTGTPIKTFKASGTTLKSLSTLCDIYQRIVFYRDSDDTAYFTEYNTRATSVELETGTNIRGRIQWNNTGEDIVNNVTVIGGRQLDWATQSFTTTVTEVTLTASPIDTEITVGTTKLRRGVNSSDPKDFYTDTSNKKIYFTTAQTEPVVRYSYSVPIKVNYNDPTSINQTFRVDRTKIDTKLTNTDDAELYAEGYIELYKDSLVSAPIKVIGNNDLEIGDQVRIIDTINDKDLEAEVTGIKINYPYRYDEVVIGRIPLDDSDLAVNVERRISELEASMTYASDISVNLQGLSEATVGIQAYLKLESADADTDVLYWDSDPQGDWGNDEETDGFDWGDDDEESYSEVFKEVGYDD